MTHFFTFWDPEVYHRLSRTPASDVKQALEYYHWQLEISANFPFLVDHWESNQDPK